ncbi:MAG: glycine betaine/L-proline ABC transporter ATP-binding protein [Actinomycetes bacterium]
MAAIEARGVYKIFGRGAEAAVARMQRGTTREQLREEGLTAAVIDASFVVEPGELFVVMGLSGSGKSTLIRMVNGLFEPTAGSMLVEGQDIRQLTPKGLRSLRRDKVSMVFQHFALFPHRTVGENAAYGLEVQGLGRSEREQKAREALQMVGLAGWEGSLPGQLSGGMRQRVGLARALAAGTDILLMDEAFSALDPLIRREMQDQLAELQHDLSKTILFITHDLNEAMRLGDHIAMMRNGEIVQLGTAPEILNDPRSDYVAQFVRDVDRSRVLTAASVMEPPVAVLGSDQSPEEAEEMMRKHELPALLVVGRDRRLEGAVFRSEVAAATRAGDRDLSRIVVADIPTVGEDVVLADLLVSAAQSPVPLPVVGSGDRLLGVLPSSTLLKVIGGEATSQTGGSDVEEAVQ